MNSLLTLLGLSLSATLGAGTPSGIVVLFVAAPQGPPASIAVQLRSHAVEGRPQRSYRYQVRSWQGEAAQVDATAPVPSGTWQHTDLRFEAAPPLDGWPARDALAVTWHADGGLEIHAGARPRLRLITRPLQVENTQPLAETCCAWSAVEAELQVAGKRRPGLALVEICEQGDPHQLLQPGTLLLLDSLERALLVRPASDTWLLLAPGVAPSPLPGQHQLSWLDGVQQQRWLVPVAQRLSYQDSVLLIERAQPAASSESGNEAWAQLTTLAGQGYTGTRGLVAAALAVPWAVADTP